MADPLRTPLVSVCVTSRRRTRALERCLESLADQIDPPPMEILVCANGDASLVEHLAQRFPSVETYVIDRVHPGASRNILIHKARGDLLLFIDDDAEADPHLVGLVVAAARDHPDVSVFGGPNVTPPGSSLFQKVQGAVLASMVASGPVRRRYGRHPAGRADERFFILCNLAIRREDMLEFDTDLVCAEENALLQEMGRRGMLMHYDPSLIVFHDRRATLRSFLDQMSKYGRGRGQLLRRHPMSIRPLYLIPSGLLAYAVVSPVLVAQHWLFAAPLIAYAAVSVAGAVKVGSSMQARVIPVAWLLIVGLHLSYGFGVLRGIVALVTRQQARDVEVISETDTTMESASS